MGARLTFTRISDTTCATAVVFASLNIRRELPLNQPVTLEFTPEKAGENGIRVRHEHASGDGGHQLSHRRVCPP